MSTRPDYPQLQGDAKPPTSRRDRRKSGRIGPGMARITLIVLVSVLLLAFVAVVAFVLYGVIYWTG
jgi:hypothetical protein